MNGVRTGISPTTTPSMKTIPVPNPTGRTGTSSVYYGRCIECEHDVSCGVSDLTSEPPTTATQGSESVFQTDPGNTLYGATYEHE